MNIVIKKIIIEIIELVTAVKAVIKRTNLLIKVT